MARVSRDQVVGALLVVVSAVAIVVYTWLLFLPPDWRVMGMPVDVFMLKLTAWVAVAGVFGLLAWMGYALATTPPPPPLEEIERRVEEEARRAGGG